jgi:hypothetical protein
VLGSADECVAQCVQHSCNRSVMNVEIDPVEVADGSYGSVWNGVTADPGMIARVETRPRNRQT